MATGWRWTGRFWTRIWLAPLSLLLGCSLVVFTLTFLLDVSGRADPGAVLELLVRPRADAAGETLSNAGEIVAAVLAIAITVVAIVVELAANRYTHRITELFVAEPINFLVTGFFVVTAVQALLVRLLFDLESPEPFIPRWGVAVSVGMLAFCLLILLPYFAFVFAFLNPVHIVDRIRGDTLRRIRTGLRRGLPAERRQQEAIRGIEQLADVALNAMENKDKGVSMASVDALESMLREYQTIRPTLDDEWFQVRGELAHNPDFVSMAADVLDDVSRRRVWLEMKIFRQFQTLYNEALNRMRDINYVVAIHTRRTAETALRSGNEELVVLTLKFFNTYLRATINAHDVRTAYNVLNQLRLLAEAALDHGRGERAVEIAGYFKYYGLVAYHANLPFILETVAYDLCELNELAYDRGSPASRALLRVFLEVDKEGEGEVQETALRGVRKAQVKLATHFLLTGDDELAREIYRDMASERPERLASIRDELNGVTSPEFWEISDRGVNFEYLPPKQRAQMQVFFGWFGDRLPAPRPTKAPSVPPAPVDAAQSPSRFPRELLESTTGLGRSGVRDGG